MDKQGKVPNTQLTPSKLRSLKNMAQRLRKHSLISTSEAASGHPSSCCSCADIVATLFFNHLRFEVANPHNLYNDRFILSKGHAAPVLWAAWAEAGAFPVEELRNLRKIDSNLEGHPTFRSPYSGAATGSLGQGLSIGAGMAFASRLDQTGARIYVLLGDGEIAEGAVWEAAALAAYYKFDNLTAIVDANRLGQSQATMYGWDLDRHKARFEANGWQTILIDGHDIGDIDQALHKAKATQGVPVAIIARTVKGKGIPFLEDANGWHGKPLKKGEELDKALAALGNEFDLEEPLKVAAPPKSVPIPKATASLSAPPDYPLGAQVATREAYGVALPKLGGDNCVVALDGDCKNSTYSEKFMKAYPDRFLECFIAEQCMVGAAAGLGAQGKIPFASTFACFLSRAYDFIRMAGIGQVNLKLCGSHAGISIGEDGPSQMGLEDIAMMRPIAGSTVLYPSDAVSTERLVELAAQTPGIVYIRTTRPKTPVLYDKDEVFKVGGCKVLKSSPKDRATIVAAGITIPEALKAAEQLASEHEVNVRVIDLYSVKPLDVDTLRRAARETAAIVTVEDHYIDGGIGEAVAAALAGECCQFRRLAVREIPRSGKAEQLLEMFGISASHIVKAVREVM